MNDKKQITIKNKPIKNDETFQFYCHAGLPCFTNCCRNADMYLYPYDIIRMKNKLGITSEQFLEKHTITALRDNPYFPNVMLKMSDQKDKACSFLSNKGCTVYEDRPFSCRAYPMERAVSQADRAGNRDVLHFIAMHSYCKGHNEPKEWTIENWMGNQEIIPYSRINDLWVDVDAIFRTNPWGEQGLNSKPFKMAFMACYNIDAFKNFVFESSFLNRFTITEDKKNQIMESETELLKLGFNWITFFLTGKGPLAKT